MKTLSETWFAEGYIDFELKKYTLLAYLQEIAGRTEQFWCPIKHAKRIKTLHSRYRNFFSYGDAETYRSQVNSVRRDFKDLG